MYKKMKKGMAGKVGGMGIISLLLMLMIVNVGATTVNVSIEGIGDDLVIGTDYANFTVAVTNATNVTEIHLYGGENATNLTELHNWTGLSGTNKTVYYNWTNLTDGTKYYWKIAVLDNGTWVNETGNFTIQVSQDWAALLTGEEAYKTWITGGLLLLGFALQGSREYRKIGAILLILGVIAGAYWLALPMLGVI